MTPFISELELRIISCQRCPLWETCSQPVPSSGSYTKPIMIIGEAPGRNEDEQHKPFVGDAGAILDNLLTHIGVERNDIYITNMVKCRPPENRTPKPDEMDICSEWLLEQIRLMKPKYVITLGNVATRQLFRAVSGMKIELRDIKSMYKMHGTFTQLQLDGPDGVQEFTVFATFHPASVLYRPERKELLERDFDVLGHSKLVEVRASSVMETKCKRCVQHFRYFLK